MYVYVKKVRQNGRTYYYLVIEEYEGKGKRRPIAHISVQRIIKELLGDGGEAPKWCGGRDLNPRRPTPSGPQPDPPAPGSNGREVPGYNPKPSVLKQRVGVALSQKLLREFEAWCRQRSSEETCRQYSRKLQEIDAGLRQPGDTRWHTTAYKRLARFLCEEKHNEKACTEFKAVRSRRSSPDLYVPSEEELREALRSSIGWFYQALLESGLRAVEVARVLSESSRLRWVEKGGFARVELNWRRGAKRALWGYFLGVKEERPVDLDDLQEKRQALELVGFKYVRKFVATKLVELGCQELAIDFIQGRVPQSILGKHYAKLLVAADRCYEKYAGWLRKWMGG